MADPCLAMFESNVLLLIVTLLDSEYKALNNVLFNIVKLLEVMVKVESTISKALMLFDTDTDSLSNTFAWSRVYMTVFVLLML